MGHCEMLRFLRHGAIVHNIEGVSFLCRITNFDRTPSLCRYLPCSYSFSRHFLAYGGRLYSLQSASVDHSRLTLTMNQPGWPVQHNVHLSNWVIVSQIYKHDVSISLLLGKNDDERMRLLISPWGYGDRRFAEIKTIPLTWAEAQAELNRLWEKRYGNGDYEPPEESDPDNKVINDLEMSDDGEDSLDSYFEEVDDDLKD